MQESLVECANGHRWMDTPGQCGLAPVTESTPCCSLRSRQTSPHAPEPLAIMTCSSTPGFCPGGTTSHWLSFSRWPRSVHHLGIFLGSIFLPPIRTPASISRTLVVEALFVAGKGSQGTRTSTEKSPDKTQEVPLQEFGCLACWPNPCKELRCLKYDI